MQLLIDNAEKAKLLTGYDVSNYLNKYSFKYGRSWTYLHRVLYSRLHNPEVFTLSIIYRMTARELGKTPITVENGIRNIMKKNGYNIEYTPKQLIDVMITDMLLGRDPEVKVTFTKTFAPID